MKESRSANNSSKKLRAVKDVLPVLDLGLLEYSIGFALRMASLASTQRFHKAMRPFDLRPAQFSAMVLIGLNPGLRQRDLCEALRIEKANFVGILDILQRRNLAERRADPKDRRRHAIFLTKEGQALLRKASRTHAGLENGLQKRLRSGNAKDLLDTLAALK